MFVAQICHWKVNVNVHVYRPDIPVSSVDCTNYTLGIATHSFAVSSPLGRIQHLCILLAAIANHYNATLNKSLNATVNIFIFSFLTYLFQSISTRRESLSKINIFHNYTVYQYY